MPELSELEHLRLKFNAFINERPQLRTVEDMTEPRWVEYREWFYQLSDVITDIEWRRMHAAREIEARV
jgi:hypothetical protein